MILSLVCHLPNVHSRLSILEARPLAFHQLISDFSVYWPSTNCFSNWSFLLNCSSLSLEPALPPKCYWPIFDRWNLDRQGFDFQWLDFAASQNILLPQGLSESPILCEIFLVWVSSYFGRERGYSLLPTPTLGPKSRAERPDSESRTQGKGEAKRTRIKHNSRPLLANS